MASQVTDVVGHHRTNPERCELLGTHRSQERRNPDQECRPLQPLPLGGPRPGLGRLDASKPTSEESIPAATIRSEPGDAVVAGAGPSPDPATSAITPRTASASLWPDDRSLSTESRTPTVRRAEATIRPSRISRARVLEVPPSRAITRDQARTIAGSLRVMRMFLAFFLPSVAGRAMLSGSRVVTISQDGLHRDPSRDRSSG